MKGTNPNCNLSFIWLIPLIIFLFIFFPLFLTSASSFLIPSLYREDYINNVESFKMREAAAAVKMTFFYECIS